MINEARPLALPFYHRGMDLVAPHSKKPQGGHRALVLFGEPTDCDDVFVAQLEAVTDVSRRSTGRRDVWQTISEWAYAVLSDLELAAPSSDHHGKWGLVIERPDTQEGSGESRES